MPQQRPDVDRHVRRPSLTCGGAPALLRTVCGFAMPREPLGKRIKAAVPSTDPGGDVAGSLID
jgi:hypothetical protein